MCGKSRDERKGAGVIDKGAALKVVRFYVLLSGLWIIASDGLVYLRGGVDAQSALLSMSKGLVFVAVTAGALFLFMTRLMAEKQVLSQRLGQFVKFANDIVLMIDSDGRVIDANDRAAEAYGYSLADLMKMTVGQLRCDDRDWLVDWSTVQTLGHVRFEALHRRADGSCFPVEVSSRRIDVEGGRAIVQSIVRDISERKEAERQILRLKEVYAALSQTNQCIVRCPDREELFRTICRIAIDFGHFRMAWIGVVDPATQSVVPVEWAGDGTSYLDGLLISTNPDSPFHLGPVGQCVASGTSHIVNDFEHAAEMTPWQHRAFEVGFKACAAFPLLTKGKVVGALVLYSIDAGFFVRELVDLLKEMAFDISYALDRFEAEKERLGLELDLIASNARSRGIIDGSQDLIATMDADLRYTGFNRAYADFCRKLTGGGEIQPGMVLNQGGILAPDQFERFSARWRRALAGERATEEWSLGEGDDQVFYDSLYAPLLDPSGQPIGAFHIGRDVTRHKKMEHELRKLSMAVEQSPVTVVITDRDGNIQYTNPAFTTSSGYSAAEAIGKNPRILKGGEVPNEEYAKMWTSILGGAPWFGLFHNRRKDGSLYWEEAAIAPVRDAEGAITQFIAIKQDVTKRREAEENAAFLTHHDALTRLPNRLLGKDRMERAMVDADRQDCKAALLIVNIDHFKRVNDSLGSTIGDALVRALADRLRGCIRETDTLSRQSGDEFLIVLSGVNDAEATIRVASQILEQTVPSFRVGDHELSVTVSIGIAVYPDDGRDFDVLLRRANRAMSHAKEAGRNTYRFFAAKMNVDANEYLSILNGLRKALERGEFVLHYQPQISLASGRIVGAEALVRWNHPELGLIAPGKFIAIAEDSGLIVEIGEWVAREACRQAVLWPGALTVAVNLSVVQFTRGGLLQSVKVALAETGLDPSRLELELTESILIKDTGNVLATVKQLKALGVKLSIDDFGTGYSSLAYLRLLDLDRLKIDQSFVRDIAVNHDDETIVKAIIQLAQGLGLKTVAEGVENSETLDVIRRQGCDEVQGYHFARPMPAGDFSVYLTEMAVLPR
ncbi:EAL domain-containing protein [Telmatospirillum sp.]|uniref:sensor domain-containing phosphodiesterase n=1 Tax=Telmatospirillum sp. TaxID=2079197 RepID=UPI00283B6605|nr:EAL domain-containing protein [Telmatospirillum sp.]MDR3435352.1 EAL domain-containing protein [Telmatospirillum sp.]